MLIATAPIGQLTLSALADAVTSTQRDDPFGRVVVVADHSDVAAAVRHLLGARGVINVTVQAGQRLAAELAGPAFRALGDTDAPGATPPLRPLNRLGESQAVRRIADDWLESAGLWLSQMGRRRLYAELTDAFRQREQRPAEDVANTESPGDTSLNLPRLYDEYCALLDREGYYTRHELPELAAKALSEHWPDGTEPAVIYYLPRHPQAGELELMQTLLRRGKCRVIVGLTGDEDADEPALALRARLTDATDGQAADTPLQQAVADNVTSIIVAPDPAEETRAVVRRIVSVADTAPFHRIAILHRRDMPYASLLRQELDAAGVPYSGAPRRTLADTGAGRLLLGMLNIAGQAAGGIDREALIDLMTSTPLRNVSATQLANLASASRANGAASEWERRLTAYAEHQREQEQERTSEPVPPAGAESDDGLLAPLLRSVHFLIGFVRDMERRLERLRAPDAPAWTSAAAGLRSLLDDYHRPTPSESLDDYNRILELVDSLQELADWNADYGMDALRDAVSESLQIPVSERGRPVGSGVYVGPPAGVVGAYYDRVFVVGMVEGHFPPPHRVSAVSAWLDDGAAARIQSALERYEFLGALAAAGAVTLSYPTAGTDRQAAYPSRWLLEAANLLHQKATGDPTGRLTAEKLTQDAGAKPWLAVISSRERGMREMTTADSAIAPAYLSDYNLTHLLAATGTPLDSHPALASDVRMRRALDAGRARGSNRLTEWDGLVGGEFERVVGLGSAGSPVSPSGLETWATCPYRFFLSRILGLRGQPDAEEEEISALDRGLLVHKILERFVGQDQRAEEALLALAAAEFADAELRGVTGYPLLWEMEKQAIADGLRRFFAADADWLGETLAESRAEVPFDDVDVTVDGLGTVRFRGKIDRLDVVGGEVRVRDFKTGRPDRYTARATSQNAYTVANGRALQLPVYTAAARQMYPEPDIRASYCFPLSDRPALEARPYHDAEDSPEFHATLQSILGTARAGIFPATPDGAGQFSACRNCDFNRLCPTRRRQIWERKGRHDPDVQPYNRLGGPAAITTASENDD